MFANLNYVLLIVLIVLKRHLADGQESHEQASYEEMDPDSREEQLYRSKLNGAKSSSATASPDDESSYENQMPQQAKTEKENGPNVPNNHQDNGAFPHPVFNPFMTLNPYVNHEHPMFRQMPAFLPMQAQASYGSYDQLPGYAAFHQPPLLNPLLYQPVMYGQQHFPPFANQGDHLRSMLAPNQQIITYTPIDDKMIEHVSYLGHRRPKKSNSRMLDEHGLLYTV